MPLMSGAVPQLCSSDAAVGAVRQFGVLLVDEAAEIEFAQLFLAADLLLQRTGVVGDRPLQHGRQVEHQRDRQQDRHDPCRRCGSPAAGAGRRRRARPPAARRARRTTAARPRRRRRTASAPPCRARWFRWRPRRRWPRAPGPRTGTYSTPSASPRPKPLWPGAELLLRKLRERLLQERLELREDQPEADRHQCDERHPADRVLGQMQQGQQRRTEQGDDAEAEHQAGDHAVGPQRFRQRALGSDLRGHGARRVGFRLGRAGRPACRRRR